MIEKNILLYAQSTVKQFLQKHAVNLFKLVNSIKDTIIRTNRRALSVISSAIMLSVFLSACGGGGGGGAATEPAQQINANTTPTFIVTSSRLTFNEDVVPTQSIATVSHATSLTVNQSSTGVVNLTTSVNGVTISNRANAFGQTILTISASNGNLRASTQVVVTVNAINDTPTLTVTTNSISTLGGFAQINIGVTAQDVEQGTLTFTVDASTLVRVTTSANAILLDAIAGASGQTTLTVRVSDNAGVTVTQTIAVNVSIVLSAPPQLMISTSRLILQEDFTTFVVVTATATDADGDAITLSISSTTHLVNAISSVIANNRSSITLSSVSNRNGTTTLTVRATDAGGQSTAVELVVVIMAVNDPPILTVSTNALVLNEDFASTQSVVTVMNVDGDAQVINVTQSNSGVINVTTSVTGVFVSSIANASGQTTLTIAVSDSSLTVTTQVAVTVLMVNDPPTIAAITTTSLTLSEDFATPFSIVVIGRDIDGHTLTISVSASRTGVVTVTTLTSSVRVSRIAHANGQTTLTISVNDGMVNASTQVVVQVLAVNDPPTITLTTNNISTIAGFSAISIGVTANDVEQGALTFIVEASTLGVVRVTTSANSIVLNAVPGGSGQTILTVRTADPDGLSASQTIAVNVSILSSSSTPVLTVSTNHIIVQESFTTPVVIAITATDADGDQVNLFVSSASHLVDVAISPLSNGQSNITLTAITNLNGTTTLTVRASDAGGQFDSTQIVVVVNSVFNPISLTLSTSVVSLSAFGNQLNRNVQNVSISNPGNENIRAQFGVSMSGDSIFSANPTPLVSFSTTAVVTETTLDAIAQTAQLYFTIAPGRTGTSTLTVQLTNQAATVLSQQTLEVSVTAENVPFGIGHHSPNIQNIAYHGGRLYANSSTTARSIDSFLSQARTLGGHLININSIEEFNFVRSVGSGLVTNTAWFGLVLPQQSFPGALAWVANDSTVAYGFVSTTVNTTGSITVYPGHYPLSWNSDGLIANRQTSRPSVFNWTYYSGPPTERFSLLGDVGDQTSRAALYEFPQGIASPPETVYLSPGERVSIPLVGYDLNGQNIFPSDWSLSQIGSGTASLDDPSRTIRPGIHRRNLMFALPSDASGFTDVFVQLTVNSVSATPTKIRFISSAPRFTLPTSTVVLTQNSSQTIRHQLRISNIIAQDLVGTTDTNDLQWRVTHSGDPIFSTNPVPVVSFSTNAVMTTDSIGSTPQTAQLYFTIFPGRTGTATLTLQLSDLSRFSTSQQTIVIQVNPVAKPPVIAYANTNIANLSVYGGHLYANSVRIAQAITSFLPEAKALGGHLININTVEEFNFVNAPTNPIIINESWLGLVLPELALPGELSWVANNSTVAYGFVSTTVNTTGSITVYPGHYNLNWHSAAGLIASRDTSRPSVFNWTIYVQGVQRFYLVNDSGDQNARRALYEFPQGLNPVSMMPRPSIVLLSSSSSTVNLTGFDLNGDAINTAHWSARDPGGGTVRFNATYQSSGVQTVEMVYTPDQNFDGPTTVVVTLQVNGLSTTAGVSFAVDAPPTLLLSTNTIVLNEDFTPFVIGTTVTDGPIGLSYTLQASTSAVLTITTSTNAIRLTPIAHVSGSVTLTVQATDSTQQTVSTEVVVTVRAVNDPPTLFISSDSISTIGGFVPIVINTTATDVEDGPLSFSVQVSTTGIVGISTSVNTITLSPLLGRSGQTTLTVSAIDISNSIVVRTIAVNVIVSTSTTPVLSVSTNRIYVQEDFTSAVFIGTTATDTEQGRLTATVTASTPLVNTVVSVQGITLSPMSNRHGTVTLTVRATDTGGLFDSTEIVVIVTPVNDTPTLTVSMHTVALGSVPIVLNVSASDVDDGILPFSVSSGQNLVRTTVATTNLTLSRLESRASTITLTLSTTDTAGVTISTQIVVTLAPFFTFTVTTGIKTLDFAWSALSNATHYQLRSNPDGNSGFVDLTTTGVVVSPNSTMIRQTTAQARVGLHRYIPKVNGPQYAVNICTTTPCGSSFQHNSVALTNAQLNSLIGRLQANNGEIGDFFGASVRISGDGNTLVVAATGELSLSTGVNGVQNNNGTHFVGAVYIFRRNGSNWSQQAYIKALYADNSDNFGASIDLSDDGNILAVGAFGESGGSTGINGAQDLNNATNSGAAYVFRFSGGVWSQQAYIKAPISQGGVYFGIFVSLSGDGNTLAVGEYLNDSGQTGVNDVRSVVSEVNSGAAYVFRFSEGVWSQQAFIKASNTGRSDNFGEVVSLSSDGNTLAVAAPAEAGASTGIDGVQSSNAAPGAGAVYLFRFSGNAWAQQAYIKASNTQAGDRFGQALSLSSNGNTLVVSALNEDGPSTGVNGLQSGGVVQAGAAYLYRFSGGVWSQQAYIKASNTGVNDRFGRDVSLSADGNTLAVGANLEDSSASGVGGAENNDSSMHSGAVYVFEFRNGIWSQQAYIKSNPNVTGAFFGSSVHLSNDGQTLVVGGSGGGVSEGAVYLY